MEQLPITSGLLVRIVLVMITDNIFSGMVTIGENIYEFTMETVAPLNEQRSLKEPRKFGCLKSLYSITIELKENKILLGKEEYTFFFNLIVPHAKEVCSQVNKLTLLNQDCMLGFPLQFIGTNEIIRSYYVCKCTVPPKILTPGKV